MVSEFVAALILAVVQGITEWFPVSSSGHLVLFERMLDYSGGLMFEVALHFGTLMAVFVYFGKEITDIFRDFFSGKWKTENGKLGVLLIVASIPAGIVGFLVKDFFGSFSSLGIVAFGFGITGLFLFIVGSGFETKGKKLNYKKSFLIGCTQALAIVPGISRSGATISSGILFGLSEKKAMTFAFLMAIPIILGANILVIGNQTLPSELIWATLVSFIVGLASIHVVFKYVLINRKNFRWFGIYCILLALGVLIFTKYI